MPVVALARRAAERYGVRIALYALALGLLAVPFGLLLDQVVRDGPLVRVDTWAANHLHSLVREEPAVVGGFQVVSFFGRPPVLAALVVAVGLFLLRRRRIHLAVYLVTTTVIGGLIDIWVKVAVGRDRPSLDEPVATAMGKSFPSGHAMSSTIAYGALLLVLLPLVPARWRSTAVGPRPASSSPSGSPASPSVSTTSPTCSAGSRWARRGWRSRPRRSRSGGRSAAFGAPSPWKRASAPCDDAGTATRTDRRETADGHVQTARLCPVGSSSDT